MDSFSFVARGGFSLSFGRRGHGLATTFLIFAIGKAFETGIIGKDLACGGVEGSGFSGDGEEGRGFAGIGGERSTVAGEGTVPGASVPEFSVALEMGSSGAGISRTAGRLSEERCNSRISIGQTDPPDGMGDLLVDGGTTGSPYKRFSKSSESSNNSLPFLLSSL